jgi:recA bacterial DNA recombination protein
MSSLAVIHAPVQSRVVAQNGCSVSETFLTGIPAEEHCGIERGILTQLCAGSGVSSGRTALLFSIMAQFTRCDHFCALVDAGDCFDPISAEAAGVELDRVLWVRCGQNAGAGRRLNPLEQAFKTADILVQSGGFHVIAVDLSNLDERRLRKVPLTTWFRFARVAEKMQTALVFFASYPAAQSCAGLTLHMTIDKTRWSGTGTTQFTCRPELVQAEERALAQVLEGAECRVEIGRTRKPVQSVKPNFTATAMWK